MDDLLSEKEQIEQLRTWWSDYGLYVIGGVVIGAGLLFGWNYVQSSQKDAEYAASNLYGELTDIIVDADVEAAEALAGQLSAEYPDSSYAAQARLAMARLYMDANRDQDAADTLRDLVASNASDDFKKIGQIRLAKLLLYQDKADEVLPLLAGLEDGAYAARAADVLGDAYVVLGRISDAREAYQRALAETGNAATVNQQFVQYKLLDLPVAEPVEAASELPDAVVDKEVAGVDETPAEDAAVGTEDAVEEDAAVGAEDAVDEDAAVAAEEAVDERGADAADEGME